MLVQEPVVMNEVKGVGNMVSHIPILGLDHAVPDFPIFLRGKRRAGGLVGERERARRVEREFFVGLFQDGRKDRQRIVLRLGSQRVQGDQGLRGIVEARLRRSGVRAAANIHEGAVILLPRKKQL
jgi:hypothetical protein